MFSLLQNWIFFVSALAGLVGFWFIAYGIGYKKGKRSLSKSQDVKTEQLLLDKIYAPLRRLLIDTHISSCQSIMYPYLRIRLKRASPYLKQRAFKKFFRTIFDKGISKKTTGVDFGCFPIELIENIVKDNIAWCDSKLVSLLQGALRVKYENPYKENLELDNEDIKLIDHIYNEYDKLNKKLISKHT